MIGQSVEKVEAGAAVVADAESTIGRIVENSRKVGALLVDVARSSEEQELGVTRIGQAIHALDHMTHENGSLVESTAAAARTMKTQADELAAQVARFRLPA